MKMMRYITFPENPIRAPLWISYHVTHVKGGWDYMTHCYNYLGSAVTVALLRPQNTIQAHNFKKKWQPFRGPKLNFYPDFFSAYYDPY